MGINELYAFMKRHLDNGTGGCIKLYDMKIRILGCSGGLAPGHRTTSFLINGSVLIDAGTVSEALEMHELRAIRAILVSHAHMDHIKDLLTLADNLNFLESRGVALAAVGPVLDALLTHLFNDKICPDFTRIPSPDSPIFTPLPLTMEKTVVLDGIEATPVAVNHTAVCSAFVVKENGRGFLFTADSGRTERCWDLAGTDDGIEMIMADVSFPNSMGSQATLSGHMTPAVLKECIHSYGLRHKTIYVTHMKPYFCKEIMAELTNMGEENIRFLEQGSVLTI